MAIRKGKRPAAHVEKMARKKAARAHLVSDYPQPETKVHMVEVAGVSVPRVYETGRILGSGGYVATKNDNAAYRKQVAA